MTHWIQKHPDQLKELEQIVEGTEWNLEYGDSGSVELNHTDGARISITYITFTGGENYYKLEHVNDTDPFGDASDPQREESEYKIEDIVKHTRHTVQNNL